MKTLIFAAIFSAGCFAQAQPQAPNELSDQQAVRRLVSVARNVDNGRILASSNELQGCRTRFPTPAGATESQLQALQNCIKQTFSGRSAQEMAQISDRLQLETFQLIPSKTTENITKYLTTKTYQAMTGIDLEDEDDPRKMIQAQKFGTKKMVDQKAFFELYKNQMAKNVIYEISRFCFNDLRNTSTGVNASRGNSSFMEHWNDLGAFTSPTPQGVTSNDSGSTPFPISSSSSPDASSAYPAIVSSIMGTSPPQDIADRLGSFFEYCAKQIDKLCKDYETSCQDSASGTNTTCTGSGKACLTKNRIIGFRRALAASEDSIKKFTEDTGNNYVLALDPGQTLKRYQGGNGQNEKSYNELTNTASVDFFEANEREDYSKARDCVQNNGRGTECDEFSLVDNSVKNIETNTEIAFRAKREAEMVRVKELQGQDLEKYLKDNYPDLVPRWKDANDLGGPGKLEEAIAKRWDGQREAMIAEIKSRIESRQITEEKAEDATDKANAAKATAQAALDEKARLSQVVFFNNIISSSLNLKFSDGRSAGRNTQGLKNELDSLEAQQVQSGLFQNLRQIADSGDQNGGQGGQRNNISDIGFLYELIGLPKEEENANGRGTAGTQDRR